MTVPEEWPPRSKLRLWALQNPAYRPADTLFHRLRFDKKWGKPLLRLRFVNSNCVSWAQQAWRLAAHPVPLTPIITHVIPNHPVDGVFRRGSQALKKR